MKIKITKKLIKISYSSGLIIDKPILKKLNLENGDYVEATIKKVENGK